jgi:hypothetical protein
MSRSSRRKCALILTFLTVGVSSSQALQAEVDSSQSFICQQADTIREVAVNYPTQSPVPCEVTYSKEGIEQILWTAQHEENYCESQAQQLMMTLEDSGWSCSQGNDAVVSSPAAEYADETVGQMTPDTLPQAVPSARADSAEITTY